MASLGGPRNDASCKLPSRKPSFNICLRTKTHGHRDIYGFPYVIVALTVVPNAPDPPTEARGDDPIYQTGILGCTFNL